MENNFTYSTIPDTHKFIFHINTSDVSTQESYNQMIRYMRHMCTEGGADVNLEATNFGSKQFEKLKAVNPHGSHKLLEIIVHHDGKNVNLVFSRKTLYLLGYVVPATNEKWQLQDKKNKFFIEGFKEIKGVNLRYSSRPFKSAGIGTIVSAVYILSDSSSRSQQLEIALESCFVNFSESARFVGIQNFVASTMNRLSYHYDDLDEEQNAKFLSQPKFAIDVDFHKSLPSYTPDLVKNFQKLSTSWTAYVLSNMQHSTLTADTSRNCRVLLTEDLRVILGFVKPHTDQLDDFLKAKLSQDEYEKVVPTINSFK